MIAVQNKKKIEQENELNQMEKISGGTEFVAVSLDPADESRGTADVKTCPWCKQVIAKSKYDDHLLSDCPNVPPRPLKARVFFFRQVKTEVLFVYWYGQVTKSHL